jgi:SAM-dependent methyltransferase
VLVLGSGEGFGAALLAEDVEHVLAIEPDAEAVLHARYNYRRPNLVFNHGEPHQVMRHTEEGSFDLIMAIDFHSSSDVAEQIVDWAPKALRPEGVLLVSMASEEERGNGGHGAEHAGPHQPGLRGTNAAAGTNGTGTTHGLNGTNRAGAVARSNRRRAVASDELERMLRDRFPEVGHWRQSIGSCFANLSGDEGQEVASQFFAKEKDVFVASQFPEARLIGDSALGIGSELAGGPDLLAWIDPVADRERASTDPSGIPAASIELAQALGLDETRLRRQVVAYDAAVGSAVADAREARRETETARADLEITEIELWAARRDLEHTRADAERLAAELAEVAAEAEALRKRLDAIEASRTYRTARTLAGLRPSFPNR